MKEINVDLFCGGGGATQGIEDAGHIVHECINHAATAIEIHTLNHPQTHHRCGDVWSNDPVSVAAGRPVGLLWASPDCRHFSRAKGSAPVSRRVRDLAWVVTKWAKSGAKPRVIIVENVPEFLTWGPLRARLDDKGEKVRDVKGRLVMEPIPERAGETFRRWRRMLERMGYKVEHRVLDAADYGSASRRKRLYLVARRDGNPIVWPVATHGSVKLAGEAGLFSGGVKPHRAAAEIIDWSDLGTSIFDRKRPLAEKTLKRIAEGIRRYVLDNASPFLLRLTQTGNGGRGWHVSSVAQVMPTQTTRQDLAVCVPLMSPLIQSAGGPECQGVPVDQPMGTVLTRDHRALVTPLLTVCAHGEHANGVKRWGRGALPVDAPMNAIHAGGNNFAVTAPVLTVLRNHGEGASVGGPTPTITSGGMHTALAAALMVKFYGNETGGQPVDAPMGTATTRDRHALVCVMIHGVEYVIVDILFRMLKPAELAAAMGFPAHYIWPKTQREAVRLIGNAVSPPQAAALVRANLGRAGMKECAA